MRRPWILITTAAFLSVQLFFFFSSSFLRIPARQYTKRHSSMAHISQAIPLMASKWFPSDCVRGTARRGKDDWHGMYYSFFFSIFSLCGPIAHPWMWCWAAASHKFQLSWVKEMERGGEEKCTVARHIVVAGPRIVRPSRRFWERESARHRRNRSGTEG